MQARFDSFRGLAANRKSKRSARKGKAIVKTVQVEKHIHGSCTNVGCIKCYGINFNPFLVKGIPYHMPQWMYMKWQEEHGKNV